ncbi:hypothetical protein HNP46_000431 [Pseudomonas nitritireducens]|uniref:Uncharacterized protein n=1 Tax=Pseudomonas nitroreducens TaxID=46680 RepID=A0A7W7NZS7_PSENT|nr:hypothetical protein [Pseudomonas nitritireducens]MBB4861620.1 hypothetical protein [Pseudomonas nitritireducens]
MPFFSSYTDDQKLWSSMAAVVFAIILGGIYYLNQTMNRTVDEILITAMEAEADIALLRAGDKRAPRLPKVWIEGLVLQHHGQRLEATGVKLNTCKALANGLIHTYEDVQVDGKPVLTLKQVEGACGADGEEHAVSVPRVAS